MFSYFLHLKPLLSHGPAVITSSPVGCSEWRSNLTNNTWGPTEKWNLILREMDLIVIMFSLVCNKLKQSIVFHGCRERAFHGFSGTRRFVFEEVYAEAFQPTYQMGFPWFSTVSYLPLKLEFWNIRSENSFILLCQPPTQTVFTSSSLLTDSMHNKCPCSHPAVRLRAAIGGSFIGTAQHFTLKEQINSIESFF